MNKGVKMTIIFFFISLIPSFQSYKTRLITTISNKHEFFQSVFCFCKIYFSRLERFLKKGIVLGITPPPHWSSRLDTEVQEFKK